MKTHLDLCSGIGGFALAAQWAGYRTIGFCEIDPLAKRILRRHWPDVPIHDDIRTLTGDIVRGWVMGAKRKDYDDAVHMYEAGGSIADVAKAHGISRQAMWKILRRRGMDMRPHLRFGEDNHFYRGGPMADGRVHDVTEQAIRDGSLVPQPCQRCGADGLLADGRREVHAHHDDYNKPLAVSWLCQNCHHEWHKVNRAIGKEVMPNEISGANEYGLDLLTAGY